MLERYPRSVVVNWSLALAVIALLAVPLAAAEKGGELKTGEEAILAALDEKTSLEFVDEPLSNVVEYFKDRHRMEIQIDHKALEDVGVGLDTPITRSVRNVTFRSGLNLILRDLDLAWTVTDEVLLITTPETVENCMPTRIYDVSRLVAVQDPGGRRWQDFDSLIAAITATIAPMSWDDVGGQGSIAPLEFRGASVLIVRQTFQVQLEIGKLLENLAKTADQYGSDVLPTREPKKAEVPGPMVEGFLGGAAPAAEPKGEMKGFF